jgi:hypothetical protein
MPSLNRRVRLSGDGSANGKTPAFRRHKNRRTTRPSKNATPAPTRKPVVYPTDLTKPQISNDTMLATRNVGQILGT